jgi:hypothetical protein
MIFHVCHLVIMSGSASIILGVVVR